MPNALTVLGQQLATLWKHLGINQKVSIVLALAVAIGAIAGTVYWTSRPDYRLLYTGLSLQDAARARERLEDEKIPVQVRAHGQAIYVPAAHVYRARLMLAADGLPKEHGAGFELFEQPKFGLTEFAQQVNFQRALQGELERTIMALDGVRAARVMLVLPRDRLFASERDKTASASIMLTLAQGAQLREEQIHSIRQLVGTAVPGLSTGHVTITDHQGRMLADSTPDGANSFLGTTKTQLEIRRALETELTRRVQEMLDISIGQGRSVVRVNADMDFREIERHQETFDADGRVLYRETISTESSSDPLRGSAVGAARVAVGDPNAALSVDQGRSATSRREDVDSHFRVPSGREIIVDRGGRVERLSVSVSVAQGQTPRTASELEHIERLVRSAVGAVQTPQRQDAVEVVEMLFGAPSATGDQMAWPWWHRFTVLPTNFLRNIGAAILLIALLVYGRRSFQSMAIERETVGTPISMLTGQGGAGYALAHDGKESSDELTRMDPADADVDVVNRLAEQNPSVIATWIDHAVRSSNA
jgi:flagellar M-ring protein FliF